MNGFSSKDKRYQFIWKQNTCLLPVTLPPLTAVAGVSSTPHLPRSHCFPGGRTGSFTLVGVTWAPQCSSLLKQALSKPGLHALTPSSVEAAPCRNPGASSDPEGSCTSPWPLSHSAVWVEFSHVATAGPDGVTRKEVAFVRAPAARLWRPGQHRPTG